MKTFLLISPHAGSARRSLALSKPCCSAPKLSRLNRLRSGMTLIELLVVTVLLSILVSTAIPVISPNNDSRKIREASRAVNAFLAAAQAKAIETGRPYGVEFTRLSDTTGSPEDNGACTQLTQIEVPAYFTGIDNNSVAQLAINYTNASTGAINTTVPYQIRFIRMNTDANTTANLPPGYIEDIFPPSLIRLNDVIEIQGYRFRIVDGNNSNGFVDQVTTGWKTLFVVPIRSENNFTQQDFLTLAPVYDSAGNQITSPDLIAANPNGLYWTQPSSYRIIRQPTPTSGEPLQLPSGMAVDLNASGVNLNESANFRFYQAGDSLYWSGGNQIQAPTGTSPRILFTPSGSIQVQLPGAEPRPVSSSLSLCVGRVELVNYELGEKAETRAGSLQAAYNDPVDLFEDVVEIRVDQGLDTREPASEIRELTDKYNWLNMDSRWVVVSGRSGSIVTVPNTYVDPNISNNNRFGLADQLQVALQNAPTRTTAGGR